MTILGELPFQPAVQELGTQATHDETVWLTRPPSSAMCRICEPIAFMSIFPYVYFMIEDFFRNDSNKQGGAEIAVYAGMVTSAFAFAEFSSGVPWGRLSDKIGRKPVLLTGLAGTALSMLIFGFAPNLPIALLARALGGLLNGYVSSALSENFYLLLCFFGVRLCQQ
jgi:MFS family permease